MTKKKSNKVNHDKKKYILDFISSKNYVPMKQGEMASLLQIPQKKKGELQDILDTLEKDDLIIQIHRGRYKKKKSKKSNSHNIYDESKRLTGTFISHPKGFGFVERQDSDEEDVFIPAPYTGDAFHMDEVEVELLPAQQGSRQEGRIVKILSHNIHEIVGTFDRSSSFGFVIADNKKISDDIFIPKEFINNAVTGDKVTVELTHYGGNSKKPEGKVTEVLGFATDPGVDVLSVAKSYDIPMTFPPKAVRQAERCPVHEQESDLNGRMDLRDWQMVTIDGEDSKDLDDAVSLSMEDGFYKLGVHIADVSNYVQDGSSLDREALKRGTSVYLVDRVIPMLPKKLSNGICSLNQGEDRLALSCIMWIDSKGHTARHQIAETVICVNRRMTYTNVQKILDRTDDAVIAEYEELVPMFESMKQLSDILRNSRKKRGSIDFDFPESKIILNEHGKPVDVKPSVSTTATKLIEDFMLQANETVAKEYENRKVPFLYRTHENPDMDKMEGVLSFIRNQGIKVTKSREEITPKEVQQIISQIEGSPQEPLISMLLLRSMKQARYSVDCKGHFGLAADYYCHFTSPIRRYPDLQIHRIIKDDLRGRLNDQKKDYYTSILDNVANQTSATERRAEEAERETDKMKMAEYMSDHKGEVFDGTVSGVTGWGFYVQLPNTVEGLVHVNSLTDDYYVFDEENYQLTGREFNRTFRLGNKVRVTVADTDIVNKTIDFILVNEVYGKRTGEDE